MMLLALDISGNFKEGKGTTGICVMVDGEVMKLDTIHAGDYEDVHHYWEAHNHYIQRENPDHVVMEGYKLYNHKGKAASTQANSDLETPQMLGYLKMICFHYEIPYTIQYAHQIKNRWSDAILVSNGYVEDKKGRYYFNSKLTNLHMRDSMRHAIHWNKYGQKER